MVNTRLIEDNNLMFTMEMLEMHYIANIEDFMDYKGNITINGESFKLSFDSLLSYGKIAYWHSENFIVRSCPYFDFQNGEGLIPLYIEVTDSLLNLIGIAESGEPINNYNDYIKMTVELAEKVFQEAEYRDIKLDEIMTRLVYD
jgi:hypothetical protein